MRMAERAGKSRRRWDQRHAWVALYVSLLMFAFPPIWLVAAVCSAASIVWLYVAPVKRLRLCATCGYVLEGLEVDQCAACKAGAA